MNNDNRIRVLVIDDDRKLCRLIKDYLEPLGYAVQTVCNGAEGLELALAEPWQAIILDVMLPGLANLYCSAVSSQVFSGRTSVCFASVFPFFVPQPNMKRLQMSADIMMLVFIVVDLYICVYMNYFVLPVISSRAIIAIL